MTKIIHTNARTSPSPDPGLTLLVPSIGTGIVFLSGRRSFVSKAPDNSGVSESYVAAVSFSALVSHSLRPLRAIGSAGWRWHPRRKPCSSNS